MRRSKVGVDYSVLLKDTTAGWMLGGLNPGLSTHYATLMPYYPCVTAVVHDKKDFLGMLIQQQSLLVSGQISPQLCLNAG